MIERQTRHLATLLDGLLDVSRIKQGRIQLQKQVLDIAEVITNAIQAVRPLIEDRRHALTVSIAPGPMPVLADPTRIEQVLVNILTNAVKYTEAGGLITVTARLRETSWSA